MSPLQSLHPSLHSFLHSWSYKKKWAATLVVSSFTFISPISSSMVAPATEQIATQFGITNEVLIALTVSVFVLGYAVGPLVSSDVFGVLYEADIS